MKVIVSKDEDAMALRLEMQVKFNELKQRFRQQDQQQEHVVDECCRAVNFVLVGWLQAQGFKVP
jgi:hypothetical protein